MLDIDRLSETADEIIVGLSCALETVSDSDAKLEYFDTRAKAASEIFLKHLLTALHAHQADEAFCLACLHAHFQRELQRVWAPFLPEAEVLMH